MDLIDSLDLDSAQKKYDRVRSWYLYEQFKSLERNQHDAAQRLRSKSCQDRILHQELNERRVRRRLCDQFESCHSESFYEACRGAECPKTACADDVFVNLCELETDNEFFDDDIYKNALYSESEEVSRKMDKRDSEINEEFDNKVNEKTELTNTNISESVTLQLETAKDNIEYLEQYAKICDDESVDQMYDLHNFESCESSGKYKIDLYDNSLLLMWSRLVTYAYQIIKLNHGANCYYDYSSQFLASVLVCDVLRRVVSRICDILQPYVSPIKFEPSDPDISIQPISYKKKQKYFRGLKINNHKHELNCLDKKKSTETNWDGYENKQNEVKFQSLNNYVDEMSYIHFSDSQKPEYCKEKLLCRCRCLKLVFERILQLSRIVDDILEDVADDDRKLYNNRRSNKDT